MVIMANNNNDLTLPGYHKVRIIGTGARSVIWEVKNFETGTVCALKRVMINNKDEKRYIDQADNEHTILSKIEHPNVRKSYAIRKVYKLFKVKEVHLLMQYCPGKSLKEAPPDNIREQCNILAQVASIMHIVNKWGFIHADMKPGNIIVSDAGKVMIIDFGQSCEVGTIKQRIQGTPDFIAPEQINRWPLDFRTDVFNFGSTMYWTLTQKAPPPQMFMHGHHTIPERNKVTPPSKVNPDVPSSLENLVMSCLEAQPSDRPADMSEVAGKIGRIMREDLGLRPDI
jgi:serine/threonine-protein kinase